MLSMREVSEISSNKQIELKSIGMINMKQTFPKCASPLLSVTSKISAIFHEHEVSAFIIAHRFNEKTIGLIILSSRYERIRNQRTGISLMTKLIGCFKTSFFCCCQRPMIHINFL